MNKSDADKDDFKYEMEAPEDIVKDVEKNNDNESKEESESLTKLG